MHAVVRKLADRITEWMNSAAGVIPPIVTT
jgi:hypothetical protein